MSCRRFCGKENVCIVTAKNVCKSQFEPNRRRSLDNQTANSQGLWHRYQNLSAPGQKSRCQGPLADMQGSDTWRPSSPSPSLRKVPLQWVGIPLLPRHLQTSWQGVVTRVIKSVICPYQLYRYHKNNILPKNKWLECGNGLWKKKHSSIQTTHRILSKETLLAFSIPTMVWYTKTPLDPPTAKCQWDNLCSSLLSLLFTGSIAVCIHCWIQTAACDGARCMLRVSWTMDNAHQKGLWVYVV